MVAVSTGAAVVLPITFAGQRQQRRMMIYGKREELVSRRAMPGECSKPRTSAIVDRSW